MNEPDNPSAAAGDQEPFRPGYRHGFVVRCNIPAGQLTAEQYSVLDELAGRYGNGTLRVTTRHNMQLHGVVERDLQNTLREINAGLSATLSTGGEVGRHLVCCPAPAADSVGAATQAVRQQLIERLLPPTRAYHEVWLGGEKVYDGQLSPEQQVASTGRHPLPQHFKIGIAAPGDNCIDVYTHDLGLVPVVQGGVLQGFNVLVGGGMGMTPNKPDTFPRLADALVFVTPPQVLPVLEQVLTLRCEYGEQVKRPQARFKSIMSAWGSDRFRAELLQRLGFPLQDIVLIPPLGLDLHLGWHAQDDGRWYLGLSIENGRIQDRDGIRLRTGLRQLIATFQPGIRLTPNQDLLLTGLPQEHRAAVEACLHDHSIPLPHELSHTRRFAMACPALPTCGHAVAEAERALPSIIDALETAMARLGLADEHLTIRMTGCAYGCTRPYVADLAFVGMGPDQYSIFVGGRADGSRLNQQFSDLVPADALVDTALPLLVAYGRHRAAGEAFGDFCTRVGIEALRRLADGYRDEPTDG